MIDSRRLMLLVLSPLIFIILHCRDVAAFEHPEIEKFLVEGRLADGAAAMTAKLQSSPDDAVARFSLGITQFLQAVEKLGQDQHRFGILGNRRAAMPFMRLPVAENPSPEKLTYAGARAMIQTYLQGLNTAEKTLADVPVAEIKLEIRIGQIRLDLDGDGVATDDESLLGILQALNNRGGRQNPSTAVNQLTIAFDDADVLWLRGYCHVMQTIGEIILAHNWKDQFERTAHLFYPDVDSPYEFLRAEGTGPFNGFSVQNVLDVVALIHTVNYECTEPDRMKAALGHFEEVIVLSRRSWELINQETDDDREWIPNVNQTAAFGGVRVSAQMQQSWQTFLNEMDEIVKGQKLLPFWRGVDGSVLLFTGEFPRNPEWGINLRKVFTDPKQFDLVLWLQGTGAQPFLEKGRITDVNSWRRIVEGFDGNFFPFMIWFN